MANKILRLDITKIPDLTPIIYGRVQDGLVQTVDVYVTNNGEPFDLTGWVTKFEGNTSGNRAYVQDTDNVVMVDQAKGFFTYTFPLIAFSVAGKYEHAYFSFTKGEQRETTSDFNIQVFENADITAEEANSVIREYDELVAELNRIFLEAQTNLQDDYDEFKAEYDAKYNAYIADLTNKIKEAQNKIDILNSNYDKANAKLADLESRMNDLVNNGLLKMEDVLSFLGGKNVQIKVPIDFTGKISGSTVENPNIMKFNSFLAENINAEATVTAGGELISDDVEVTMWKNYKRVSALDGKLAQAQQATNGLVTYHLARIDAVSEISRRFPNLFINVGATTPAQQKEQLIKKATLVSATAYGFGLIGDAYKYTIGRSNWTTTGTTWQGWTGWNGENNSHSSSKPDPVTASVGSVDTIMDQNGVMSFIMGVPIPSDGTKILRTNLDYFVCEITLNLNINDLIPKPDLSKYYTKDEMNEAFTEHSLYSNSLDFGNYDYSGNPNLMCAIKASDFRRDGDSDVLISDVAYNSIRFTTQNVNNIKAYTQSNISSLVSGKTYTINAKVKIEEGTTGNIDQIKLSYRKVNGGTVLLSATGTDVEVGKEITIKGTSVVNYAINDLSRFYLSVWVGDDISGSVIVSDVKIEEGSTATPYQPNLLETPYYLSKVELGENILTPASFPINTTEYLVTRFALNEPYVAGQTYTFTMKATKPATQYFAPHLRDGIIGVGEMTPVAGLTDVWQITYTVTQDYIDRGANAINIFQMPQSTKGTVNIEWAKLEKGDTRTPNLNDPFKYKGIGFTKSSNPKDYNWNSAPENVDFIEEKIDEIDKNIVKTSGNQNITGIKNFTGTLQSSGVEVAKKGDSYTKTETDNKFLLKTASERSLLTIKQSIITTEDWNTITTPGIFYVDGGTGENRPTTNAANGFLFVKNANTIILTQEFDDGINKYIRQKGTSGWSPWKKIAFTNEIVNLTDNQVIAGVKDFSSIPTINSIPIAQERLGFTLSDGGVDGADRADGTLLRWGRIVGYDNQYTKDHFDEFFELSEDQKTLTIKQDLRLQFNGNFSSQTGNGSYYSYLGIRQNGGDDKRVCGIAGTVNWRNDVGWHTVIDFKAGVKVTAVLGTNYIAENAIHFGIDFCHISTVLIP